MEGDDAEKENCPVRQGAGPWAGGSDEEPRMSFISTKELDDESERRRFVEVRLATRGGADQCCGSTVGERSPPCHVRIRCKRRLPSK